jgi:hypothetical protein
MNGNNIIVLVDGVAIAAAKSCTITKRVEAIETGNSADGRAKSYIPGLREWSVSVRALVTSMPDFFTNPGQTVRLSIAVRNNGGEYTTDRVTGDAIIESAKITGTVGNLATAEVKFLGTGALERPRVRLRDNQGTPLNDSQGIHLYAIGQI